MRSFLHWIQNHMYLVDIIKLTHYEFAQKTFYENPTSVFGRSFLSLDHLHCLHSLWGPSFDKILFATPLLHQTRRPRQSRSWCPPLHRVPLGPLPACPILLLNPCLSCRGSRLAKDVMLDCIAGYGSHPALGEIHKKRWTDTWFLRPWGTERPRMWDIVSLPLQGKGCKRSPDDWFSRDEISFHHIHHSVGPMLVGTARPPLPGGSTKCANTLRHQSLAYNWSQYRQLLSLYLHRQESHQSRLSQYKAQGKDALRTHNSDSFLKFWSQPQVPPSALRRKIPGVLFQLSKKLLRLRIISMWREFFN